LQSLRGTKQSQFNENQISIQNFCHGRLLFPNFDKIINAMQAIRQIIEVKNHTFTVTLPDDFTASSVEVIILPTESRNDIPEWQQIESERRYNEYLKNPETAISHEEFLKKLDSL
jgi:hypothetical protein